MSDASNNNGRAYEFACLNSLCEAIRQVRPAEIVFNSSYFAAEKAWNTLSNSEQTLYFLSANSTIDTIFALEPNIIEVTSDILKLFIQTDKKGEEADVRDIIIERKDITWEIGLSIKHNNMAVKHCRLAKTLDFGEKWYGIPCSKTYWKDVNPIFDYLENEREKGTYFCDLPSKFDNIYIPLLKAFMKEITYQVNKNSTVPRKLVEYILSKFDFYKVISFDNKRITTIQSFNMYGTLNLPSRVSKPKLSVPIIKLPSKLLHIDFKPRSKTTIVMSFDNGWQFTFRLHNGDKKVIPSSKFDVNIVGMPSEVNIKFNCIW